MTRQVRSTISLHRQGIGIPFLESGLNEDQVGRVWLDIVFEVTDGDALRRAAAQQGIDRDRSVSPQDEEYVLAVNLIDQSVLAAIDNLEDQGISVTEIGIKLHYED